MSNIWGTLTKDQVEVLREFLNRFIDICPDADNKIDPADKKRIAKVKTPQRRRVRSQPFDCFFLRLVVCLRT